MKILILLCSFLLSASLTSQEASLSRADNIKIFNEAQSCYKEAAKNGLRKSRTKRCAQTSLEIGKALFEPDSKNIAILTYNYGKTLNGKERESVLKNAIDLYVNIQGKDSPELIDLLIDAGKANSALSIAEESFGEGSIFYADTLLAAGMSDLTRLSSKSRFLKEALKVYNNEAEGSGAVGASLANFQLGKIKMAQGKYKSSIPFLLEATKNSQISSYAHAFLVEAYDRTNQQDKATEHVLLMAKQPNRVNTEARDYIPLFVTQPLYPRRAQNRGKEGYAIIELTVSKEGLALNPTVIEEKPKGQKFGKAALKAAGSLRYVPRVIHGEPVAVPGVLYKYNFNMAR
ncbi:energy transducer TonB [Gammaproteobacteria bacterium]|nr:energy transducer TonB [Gammaproteobacteria bacterium]